ncbi:hypothetical protein BB561_004675 [Smittium simulii]|uniref:Nicotinate-nucleotide pyrophosphorylase [carboxylating] n=1 Tax=Smittium simulii TaxID=133385 RepID=A0A2T9YEW4_9FUNG|nr:hypothetical protein BB561_004675 [Smittium simulii]
MENLLSSTISEQVSGWLREDTPSFDYGGYVVGSENKTAILYAKTEGVLAGVPFVNQVFKQLGCEVEWLAEEGQVLHVETGKLKVAVVTGPVNKILLGERVALNLLARCSGIATRARKLCDLAVQSEYNGIIAGTRKTTPGFRLVEKYGMLVGGIDGHRMDLSSMVMLKDNHVWSTGSISGAVAAARKVAGFSVKIEVECQSIEDANEAIAAGADIVMLDNFTPQAFKTDAKHLKQKWKAQGRTVLVEASGGITEDTIQEYFCDSLDIVSLGSVTQGNTKIELIKIPQQPNTAVKTTNGKVRYVLNSGFTYEYFSLPDNLFNVYKSRMKANSIKKRFQSLLMNHAVHIEDSVFRIDNLFSFISDVIKVEEIMSVYGKVSRNDPMISDIVDHFLKSPSAFSEHGNDDPSVLETFCSLQKDNKYIEYLVNFVQNEISRRIVLKKFGYRFDDLIQCIVDQEFFNTYDIKIISLSLLYVILESIKLLNPRICNLIMDISFRPEIYAKLALEQKNLVKKYGEDLSVKQISEMVFLDACVTESFRMSGGSRMLRHTNKNYMLSNGMVLDKNSDVLFNAPSHATNPNYFKTPLTFMPERHINNGTAISDFSLHNLYWGLGSRMCPARLYASLYIKMAAANFIRKYEFYHKDRFLQSKCMGYDRNGVTSHNSKTIYIRPHNLLYYNSVF